MVRREFSTFLGMTALFLTPALQPVVGLHLEPGGGATDSVVIRTLGGDRADAVPPAQWAATGFLLQVPQVSAVKSKAWYWRWGALIGLTAVACLMCFKNPKRGHDN